MDGIIHMEYCLTVLQAGTTGKAGLRAVLEALLDIDIIHGHVLKSATRAFRNGWFVEEQEERTVQLDAALHQMVAWIYWARPVPEALQSRMYPDAGVHRPDTRSGRVVPMVRKAREAMPDQDGINYLHAFFGERRPDIITLAPAPF